MTTDKFLLAFQHFVGRRGLPHTVYTDNAKNFHVTSKYLAQLLTSLQLKLTNSSLNTTFVGSLSLRGQLGREDGG
jgi:hypothetical protein